MIGDLFTHLPTRDEVVTLGEAAITGTFALIILISVVTISMIILHLVPRREY